MVQSFANTLDAKVHGHRLQPRVEYVDKRLVATSGNSGKVGAPDW